MENVIQSEVPASAAGGGGGGPVVRGAVEHLDEDSAEDDADKEDDDEGDQHHLASVGLGYKTYIVQSFLKQDGNSNNHSSLDFDSYWRILKWRSPIEVLEV